MESLERLGSGTAGNHIHHGCLNFNKVSFAQKVSQEIQNFVASIKDLFDWVMQDQVQVTLSVSCVLVENLFLAVTLWDHVHAVGKANDLRGSHGELSSL